MNISSVMSSRTLRITLLADEWKSSKGGLSTMNRELAIHFAKHPNVAVTFFVPRCTEDDKKAASSHGISIVKAKERPGFESIDWLCFPPSDLVIDIIIGHGVKLGKQAQVIRDSHHCTWVQVVHTAPEELAMFKDYSGAISKGDEKQWIEVNLCKIADLVVAVGPKLHEFYSTYLSSCDKNVFNLTPGIFTELSTLKLSHKEAKKFRVLVFGRGDSEDFELKGFDIAARAVAELNDRSYQLVFVGAPSGNEDQVAEKLLKQGLNRNQLAVKGFLENRDDLALLLSRANLAIIPSRTEGFGLTALEALSAGLPFLVSQNSGFGEALQEIPWGSSWIVDSEDPEHWAEAIKGVREKGRETALKECQALRTRYAEKYSWEKQCNDLVEMMGSLVNYQLEMPQLGSVSEPGGKQANGKSVGTSGQTSSLQEDQPATEQRREADSGSSDICTATANTAAVNNNQGARPKEMPLSSPERTKLEGGNVIIVIGGDDNYKNEDEEDQVVISRWAKRKISSQFKDEFLDGRKSFIFSWNKKHRTIHEEALQHHLDPNKKGLKFEYEPKPKGEGNKSAQSLQRGKSMDEERRGDSLFSSSNKTGQRSQESSSFSRSNTYSGEQRREGSSFSRSNSAEQRPEDGLFRTSNKPEQRRNNGSFSPSSKPEQRREDSSLFSGSNIAEEKREDGLLSNTGTTRGNIMAPLDSKQGTRSKDTASTGRTERKDLAILGCNVSDYSMQAVRKFFQDIAPKVNLPANPPVENLPPIKVKQYLTQNYLKFCVLVVDVETVKDAYGNLTQRTVEYQELLKTALNEVDEKIIILICETLSFESKEDEAIVGQTIERIINEKGKGFVAWLKNGMLTVEPGVLVQILKSKSAALQPDPATNLSTDFQENTFSTSSRQPPCDPRQSNPSEWETGHRWSVPNMQQPAPQAVAKIQPTHPLTNSGESVMLRSLLRYGKISFELKDIQLWDPEFSIPDYIHEILIQQYRHIPLIGVRITLGKSGQLEGSINPKLIKISTSRNEGIQIATNETLQLKTRLRKGLVSFQESDVDFRYGSFQIPQHIIDGLKDEYWSTPCCLLFIISDEKRNFRCVVNIAGKFSQFRTYVGKKLGL
ncbi:uncharacterized protein LOC144662997 isoform X2 [Oculina patagonica]